MDVVMPQMGESIAEGTIVKWLKKPGDSVEKDEPLFEISTDKVDAEIPSPSSGTLQEILVPEGNTVEVNTVVARIAAAGAAKPAAETKPAPSASRPLRQRPEWPRSKSACARSLRRWCARWPPSTRPTSLKFTGPEFTV